MNNNVRSMNDISGKLYAKQSRAVCMVRIERVLVYTHNLYIYRHGVQLCSRLVIDKMYTFREKKLAEGRKSAVIPAMRPTYTVLASARDGWIVFLLQSGVRTVVDNDTYLR